MPDYRLVAPKRRVREHTIVRGVREAVLIPVGMRGVGQFRERAAGYMQALSPGERSVAGRVQEVLIQRGVGPESARAMVERAVARKISRALVIPVRRSVGLGQGEDEMLSEVIARARETQAKHKALIEKLASVKVWEEQRSIADDLNRLQSEFIQWGLGKVGVSAPYLLDQTNPLHAILVAVRTDIRNTIDLIEAKRVQAALAKDVKEIRESAVHKIAQTIPKELPKIGLSLGLVAAAIAAAIVAKATGVI